MDCKLNKPYHIDCPNLKSVLPFNEHYMLYRCEVCGKELKEFYVEIIK